MSDDITIRELVDKLKAATERMSVRNSHRALLLHSMSAIMQLSNMVDAQSAPARPHVELAQ